ncbi:FadR/GntR family transcriptional regulator [Glutamicibacter sp.]|uniref:FadR/GntR family transcriptional regulator n=1 Tax=Glutamicibacter sp. TaxID=1931995 RepID=UPI0028BF4E99|nr:FadR/GntR family transcriptional regulator [Glutamicibacter sp.]
MTSALPGRARGPLSDDVASWLTQKISSGQWPLDSRIPSEPVLIEELGVSRGTLREAIKALSHVGMLEVRRGDGTYVRATNEFDGTARQVYQQHSDQDVLQLRFALDTQAARLAVNAATTEQIKRLRELLGTRRDAWIAQDYESWVEADWQFHLTVAEASGNSLLGEVYRSFEEVFHGTKMQQRLREGFDGCLSAGHEELLSAIEKRDEASAADSVNTNLDYCMSWAVRDSRQ